MSRRGSVLEGVNFQPTTFEGQERGASMLLQSRSLDQQKEHLKLQREQKAKDELKDTYKDIDETYDPNKNLSGNPLADPTYNKKMAEIKTKAYLLAAQGMDINRIKMMLNPDADKLHNYSVTAKSINENLDKQLQGISPTSGYKKDVLKKKALENAMLDENGNIKDNIDEKQDYLGKVISDNPLDVTDASGLEEFVKGTMTNSKPQVIESKTYNSKGGYEKKKLKITAPDWMVLDTDERGNNTRQLVPKYEIATEDGSPIVHEFKDKSGKVVKAPVRLVDDQLFNYILKSNPSYSDNLRGQVMKAIQSGEYTDENGEPISLNSPQAKNAARALMYNDLKLLSKGGVEDVVETKPTQIKNITNINTGTGEPTINDVYGQIDERIEQSKKEGAPYLQVNLLQGKAPNIVLDEARKASGDNDLQQADIMLVKDENGIGIYHSNTSDQPGVLIKYIDKVSTNLPVQANAKGKAAVVKEGNTPKTTDNKPSTNKWDKYKRN